MVRISVESHNTQKSRHKTFYCVISCILLFIQIELFQSHLQIKWRWNESRKLLNQHYISCMGLTGQFFMFSYFLLDYVFQMGDEWRQDLQRGSEEEELCSLFPSRKLSYLPSTICFITIQYIHIYLFNCSVPEFTSNCTK